MCCCGDVVSWHCQQKIWFGKPVDKLPSIQLIFYLTHHRIDTRRFEYEPATDILQNELVDHRLFASVLYSRTFLICHILPETLTITSNYPLFHTLIQLLTSFKSSVRRLSIFFRWNLKFFTGCMTFLFRFVYSAEEYISFSDTQHEKSHLLLPQPVAWMPPWSQQENDNLHGWMTLWWTHCDGRPNIVWMMSANWNFIKLLSLAHYYTSYSVAEVSISSSIQNMKIQLLQWTPSISKLNRNE